MKRRTLQDLLILLGLSAGLALWAFQQQPPDPPAPQVAKIAGWQDFTQKDFRCQFPAKPELFPFGVEGLEAWSANDSGITYLVVRVSRSCHDAYRQALQQQLAGALKETQSVIHCGWPARQFMGAQTADDEWAAIRYFRARTNIYLLSVTSKKPNPEAAQKFFSTFQLPSP